VIKSVHGVDRSLQYDPATGGGNIETSQFHVSGIPKRGGDEAEETMFLYPVCRKGINFFITLSLHSTLIILQGLL
ncbi:hypothetical protein ACJX0J_040868, partial [Zea mays]